MRSAVGADSVRGFGTDLIEGDPPVHRGCAVVARAFARLVERFQAASDRFRARMLRAGRRVATIVDLIDDYAAELPLIIITELLGIPIDDRRVPRLRAPSASAAAVAIPETRARFVQPASAILESRRREPRGDLVSELARAEQDGDRLSTRGRSSPWRTCCWPAAAHDLEPDRQCDLGAAAPSRGARPSSGDAAADGTAIDEFLRFDGPMEFSTPSTPARISCSATARGSRGTGCCLPSINRDPPRSTIPTGSTCARCAQALAFGAARRYCLGSRSAHGSRRRPRDVARDLPPGSRSRSAASSSLRHSVSRGLAHLPVRLVMASRRRRDRPGLSALAAHQRPDELSAVDGDAAGPWTDCDQCSRPPAFFAVGSACHPTTSGAPPRTCAPRAGRRLLGVRPVARIPVDSDSTACALAALAHYAPCGPPEGALLRRFWRARTDRSAPGHHGNVGGPRRDERRRQRQRTCSARCARRAGVARRIAAVERLVAGKRVDGPRYYVSPCATAYAVHAVPGCVPIHLPSVTTRAPPPGDVLGCSLWCSAPAAIRR